jgi:hypothetical protein
MNRCRSFRDNLHHKLHGVRVALSLVRRIALEVAQGLSLKVARKVLRKQGIHAWSLIPVAPRESREALIHELQVPDWAAQGFLDGECDEEGGRLWGFGVPEGSHLPDGLVLQLLRIEGDTHLRRLPKRMRIGLVTAWNCTRLERVSGFASCPSCLDLRGCPSLRRIEARAGPLLELGVTKCQHLRELPVFPRRITRHFPLDVRLWDLPSLERVSQGGVLDSLSVRRCHGLQDLSGVFVRKTLVIHQCRELRSLPRYEGDVSGRVTDCGSLVQDYQPHLRASGADSLKMEPRRGACGLPPVQPIPSVQQVEIKPLLAMDSFEESPVWPWPPVPRVWGDLGLEGTFAALGFSSLDRVRCQLALGESLGDGLAAALSRSVDPVAALKQLRVWMHEALAGGDAATVRTLLHKAGVFGIGSLSLWLSSDHHRRKDLEPHLTAWSGRGLEGIENLEDISDRLGGVPGPLVLLGSTSTERHLLGPRFIEGPLWVEDDLTVTGCPELVSLPESLVVGGDLHIFDCPGLRTFPRRLEVQGDLRVHGLPRLARSVCRASVGGVITIQAVPALRLVPIGSLES